MASTDNFQWLRRLPSELQDAIVTFTCIAQMEKTFSTKNYDEMARHICSYHRPRILIRESEPQGIHGAVLACWLTALLDIGILIPSPLPRYDALDIRNFKDAGRTVFHIAAEGCDIQLIRRLVRLGYDINALDSDGDTAIISEVMSSRQPNLLVLQTLCEEGAHINFQNYFVFKNKVLYQSILNPYNQNVLPIVNMLLKHGASPSRSLHAISARGDTSLPVSKLVKVLIGAGAEIEELTVERYVHYYTPLAMAAKDKNVDAVQALLDAGANVEGTDTIPLFAAIEPRKPHHLYAPNTAKTVSLLCEAGADTTRLYKNQHILYFTLMSSGSDTERPPLIPGSDPVSTVVDALCEGGVDVNFRHRKSGRYTVAEDGDTPLHFASRARCGSARTPEKQAELRFMCVKTLISHGADINIQNLAGRTPLHLAAMRNELLCVAALVEHGAKLDVKDGIGRTALMLARDQKWDKVVNFLARQEQRMIADVN